VAGLVSASIVPRKKQALPLPDTFKEYLNSV